MSEEAREAVGDIDRFSRRNGIIGKLEIYQNIFFDDYPILQKTDSKIIQEKKQKSGTPEEDTKLISDNSRNQ